MGSPMDDSETVPIGERMESLTTLVRDELERMILSGEIPAGERLNENALAARLNVSRGPVREATWALEQAGLVKIIRNRGVFVRMISLEDALYLYDVRSGLARIAGRLAASCVTSEQIDALGAIYDGLEKARDAQDQVAYHEGNRLFHAKIVHFAGNPRLISYHETIEKELRLFVRHGIRGPDRLRISSSEHKQILDCIAKRDDEGAAGAFERHILNGKQRVLNSLTPSGG